MVDIITVGDGKVCARCDDAEANSPYPTYSAPQTPLHPECRCAAVPTDSMNPNAFDPYIDTGGP
jgi:hypothetical protein